MKKIPVAERLCIERRRAGRSQTEAAKRYGLTLYRYRQWESCKDEAPEGAASSVTKLDPFEECFLSRLRAKISASEMANIVGCSRWWLTQMERGRVSAQKLVDCWRGLHAREAKERRAPSRQTG